MEVKCIKDTIGFKKGDTYFSYIHDGNHIIWDVGFYFVEFKKFPEYFQEVKEEEIIRPNYKVGDYCVYEKNFDKKYIKINKIEFNANWDYLYNWAYTYTFLREPTKQELKLYFR